MSISIVQAQTSIKGINSQLSLLSSSSLIELYEIDFTNIALDLNITLNDNEKIFKFHNHVKLFNTSIYFQGREYVAAPITAQGFEISAKGTLPIPTLGISTNEEGIPYLALFKNNINKLGDIIGAKVTRIRTCVKYLDAINFPPGEFPDGFTNDNMGLFAPDIFYIDRKKNENKLSLEFELGSILDVEGVLLPARPVLANRCPHQYRGEGCNYEYNSRRSNIHGNAVLPFAAPVIATELDESIQAILGNAVVIRQPEAYDPVKLPLYVPGSCVFITKNGINYYYICKISGPPLGPPNLTYWLADSCSRLCTGCRLRYGNSGAVQVGQSGLVQGQLPFGGFLGADRVQ